MRRAAHFLLLLLLAATTGARAAGLRAPLLPAERKNGGLTLAALEPLRLQAAPAAAQLVDKDSRPVTLATWVGQDGYLLTKASEAPELEKLQARLPGGALAALREIRRDTAHDLVLAQAIGVTGMAALVFDAEAKPPHFGQWITAPASDGQLRLGVISAQKRKIPGLGAAIGVRMDEKPAEGGKGVRILGIAEDSPARAAGLRQGDILLSLDGEALTQFSQVSQLISKRQPGELVKVRYLRAGKERAATVQLASRSKVLNNWDGEDFANGGISIRTDNFPSVLQHDLPLTPADMGGPLLDLEGRALGINIARVDRITTFALPAALFWPAVQGWIQADRHPPRALPVK